MSLFLPQQQGHLLWRCFLLEPKSQFWHPSPLQSFHNPDCYITIPEVYALSGLFCASLLPWGAKHVLWTDLESKYLAFQSQMISALTTLLCGGSMEAAMDDALGNVPV